MQNGDGDGDGDEKYATFLRRLYQIKTCEVTNHSSTMGEKNNGKVTEKESILPSFSLFYFLFVLFVCLYYLTVHPKVE